MAPDKKWFQEQSERAGYESLRELARDLTSRTGAVMDHSVLLRILSGEKVMTLEVACQLAERLGVSLDEIARRAGVKG